jgi:hypothetical protein
MVLEKADAQACQVQHSRPEGPSNSCGCILCYGAMYKQTLFVQNGHSLLLDGTCSGVMELRQMEQVPQ